MHSIEATMFGGEISRPVSPKTIPLPYTHDDGFRKEVREATRESLQQGSERANSSFPHRPPPPPPPLSTVMSPTASRAASFYHVPFPVSSYMLAVQSLDPRPLEELYNEREYLIQNLRKQGGRATRLFQRYAALEAQMAGTQTPTEAKKSRREANSLRTKMAESTQQEQLILLRLGEIHVELQNRGRWMQVHHQPLLHHPPLVYPPVLGEGGYFPDHHNTASPTPSQDNQYYSSCSSALSPLSPCITPGVMFAEDIWSRASKTSAQRETENEPPTAESVDEGDEASQPGQQQQQQAEREANREGSPENVAEEVNISSGWDSDEEEVEDAQAWKARLWRISLCFPLPLQAKDKRLSLHYLKNLWPKSRRNSLQSAG